MVNSSSNYGSSSTGAFGHGGVRDWIIQRKTAIVLGLFFGYLTYFFAVNSPVSYGVWLDLFKPYTMKIITLLAVICLLQHAWVGVWTIATDYLASPKIRAAFLFVCKLSLLVYLFWTIYILRLVS